MEEPKTYRELILVLNCKKIKDYYDNITNEEIDKIYNFLAENEKNTVYGNDTGITLNNTNETIFTPLTKKNVDGIMVDSVSFKVIVHYKYSPYSSSGGGFGGSSSNNNNNNNNNNN